MERHLIVAVDSLISISYYWLNEGAFEASWTVYSLLKQIRDDMNDKAFIKRIDDLSNDIETMYKSEKMQDENIPFVKRPLMIKDGFQDSLELKVLWSSIQSIMNLFQFGSYELGFMFAMNIGEHWHLFYTMLVDSIKKSEMMVESLKEWSYLHLMFAVDLFGEGFLDKIKEDIPNE